MQPELIKAASIVINDGELRQGLKKYSIPEDWTTGVTVQFSSGSLDKKLIKYENWPIDPERVQGVSFTFIDGTLS